jgi:hypothetical protein
MMKIRNEIEYAQWKKTNADCAYGSAVFKYAEAWANLMEAQMAEGAKLADIAKDTSHRADTQGITGFMYGMAVSILTKHWEHGEQLRRWHNLATQVNDEGEKANENGGVLNPAVITF